MAIIIGDSRLKPGEIGHRAYLSTEHLWMADHCARFSRQYEDAQSENRGVLHVHLRGHVLAAITESTAFLEALVNEFLEDASDSQAAGVPADKWRPLSEYWRISNGKDSLLAKYEMVRTLLDLEPYARGENPYQAASLLVRLRNWQVHYRPRTLSETSTHELEAKLKSRFADNSLAPDLSSPWFPNRALGASCAEWCARTAREFADEFSSAVGYEPTYQWAEMPIDPPAIDQS